MRASGWVDGPRLVQQSVPQCLCSGPIAVNFPARGPLWPPVFVRTGDSTTLQVRWMKRKPGSVRARHTSSHPTTVSRRCSPGNRLPHGQAGNCCIRLEAMCEPEVSLPQACSFLRENQPFASVSVPVPVFPCVLELISAVPNTTSRAFEHWTKVLRVSRRPTPFPLCLNEAAMRCDAALMKA